MNIQIRQMRAKDLATVSAIEVELFQRSAWSSQTLAAELGGPGRWYIVATVDRHDTVLDGEVVGYAGLWFDGELTEVMTVSVAKQWQGQGIGNQLLQALISRSQELGAASLNLEVSVVNDSALQLYKKHGFEVTSVRPRYYQPENQDAYNMQLKLVRSEDAK